MDQLVAVGTPAEDTHPDVGGLPPDQVQSLVFGTDQLPFARRLEQDVLVYQVDELSCLIVTLWDLD